MIGKVIFRTVTKNANSKRGRRGLAALNAVLLLAGVVGAYQLGVANKRPPSFSQGGKFASADDLIRAGQDGRPFPYGDVTSLAPSTTALTASTNPTAPVPATQTTAPAAVLGARVDATPTGHVLAANGAYRYVVEGSEGASGFGARDFPSEMSLVVHPNDGKANERVFDLRFSQNHEEREIIRYGDDGLAFVFEAGSITFGPGTQTSEGRYNPPMVQVPFPLAPGKTVSGTSPVTDSSGNTPRTEKWKTTVIGKETINVLGKPHETWVVEIQRNTPPGANEEVDRYRKYWFDPSLGIWVKWVERFTAARNGVVKFGYKAHYTATLASFTAA